MSAVYQTMEKIAKLKEEAKNAREEEKKVIVEEEDEEGKVVTFSARKLGKKV